MDSAEEAVPAETRKPQKTAPTVAEILALKAKQGETPWNTPELVEKGFEIPIALKDVGLVVRWPQGFRGKHTLL